jgi:hypothetical protein
MTFCYSHSSLIVLESSLNAQKELPRKETSQYLDRTNYTATSTAYTASPHVTAEMPEVTKFNLKSKGMDKRQILPFQLTLSTGAGFPLGEERMLFSIDQQEHQGD